MTEPINPNTIWQSPLVSRNASRAMLEIFSPQRKFSTWRKLWLALARAQQELGLPITDAQLDEMKAHLEDIDFAEAARQEARVRHDVMAHLHTFGKVCPTAKPIMHLGATSMDIVDNTDVLIMRDAMHLIGRKLATLIGEMGKFAHTHRQLPCLAYTHLQPAQPTTVGKRAILWCYDFVLVLGDLEVRQKALMLRGIKGTTGTQASFLELFNGDHEMVGKLDFLVAEKLGFERVHPVSGQTYSRIVDVQVLATLGALAAAAHKYAVDIRLLCAMKEIEEPFEDEQVGSSAMAYKRNPALTERATGLSRWLIGMVQQPLMTAAEQMFERTLDDSSNKRLSIPEAFLTADAILDILIHVTRGLVVNPKVIESRLQAELPFMMTENLLMDAVKAGGDRQDLHERIRTHSMAAAKVVKQEGKPNDLLARLQADSAFAKVNIGEAMDPLRYVGRSPEQTEEFVRGVISPITQRYEGQLIETVSMKV